MPSDGENLANNMLDHRANGQIVTQMNSPFDKPSTNEILTKDEIASQINEDVQESASIFDE